MFFSLWGTSTVDTDLPEWMRVKKTLALFVRLGGWNFSVATSATHFTMHCLQKAPTFLPPSPPRSVMLMLALLALIKANSVMNNLHRGLHLSAQSYFINQELYHQKITEQTALWTLCNPRPAPSVHFRLCSSRKFDDQVGLGTSSFYTQCLMAGTMSKLDITINTLIIVVSWLWLPAL